jgi:hypothetical protein
VSEPESNPADVAEQLRSAGPDPEVDEVVDAPTDLPLEADPADVAEQSRDVPLEDADELG